MIRCLMLLVLGVSLALPLYNALAETNSYTVRMSCTIPVIPGVNTPLIKENSQPPLVALKEIQPNAALTLQKETQETRQVEGRKQLVKLSTVYQR